MQLRWRNVVGAFLPAVAMAFCHGCGGGGGGGGGTTASAPQSEGAAPAPASAPVVTTNQAPTISAESTVSARVGVPFDFQPSATDPENDKLTFSAQNLPPWVTFDSASGEIMGTPGASDMGEYEAITITVADATHRANASFSITVLGAANGVARLQWETPPVKVDGSPLDDLAGYRIVYGRTAEDLDHSVFILDPAQTSFEFTTLDSGTWYFAVIGVNLNGLEGPASTAAMKSI
jgi:Putative Ig domain